MSNLPPWFIRACGIAGVIAGVILLAPDNAPGAAYIKPWAGAVASLASGTIGLIARQNNVSSEQAGAKSTKPTTE